MSRGRVLLAEDHAPTLRLWRTLIEPEFEVVGTVSDGQSLVDAAERLSPDVIVSDIAMPGEDGFALVAKIRRRAPAEGGRVPVLALSAHVYPEDHQRAYAAGFQGFLNKPVTADALLRAVRSALDSVDPVERRRSERRSFVIGEAVPERRVHRRR